MCTIVNDYDNSRIDWSISAYPNSKCGGTVAQGPTGYFTTGPTALALSSLVAESAKAPAYSSGSILIIALVGLLILLALGWRYKRGKHAV